MTINASEARQGNWRSPLGVIVGLAVLAAATVMWGPQLVRSESGASAVNPVVWFLLAVAVVLLVCHLCGELLRRWGQPPVLGEILGGLLLGPSALGLAWPAGQDALFRPDVLVHLERAAQLGLIIFMFLLGCELRTDSLRGKQGRRTLGAVVTGSMGLPLLAGVGIALVSGGALAGSAPKSSYVVFVGLALAITALPVLGRILVDLKIQNTQVGAVSLSAAAIGDGLAWTALAVIIASADAADIGQVGTTAGAAVAFVLFVVLCVRPGLAALDRRLAGGSEQLLLAVLVVGAIGAGAATELIGLHPVLGAFLFGTAVPRDSAAVRRISHRMQGFAVGILLPLFFAGVGLKTSVGLLGSEVTHWLVFALVLAGAIGAKIVGAGGGARLAGLPRNEALQVGTLMNCRGITELVVATIGLEYGLISPLGFTILVLVAVFTTAATGPVMRRLLAADRRNQPVPAGGPSLES